MLHLCNDSSNLFPPVNPFNRVTSPSPASLHHGRELLPKGATMKILPDETLRQVLINNSTKQPNGCWIWKRAKTSSGYGSVWNGLTAVSTHRLSYRLFRGDPSGFHVLHRCDVKPCINPDHLWLGTDKDNIEDMYRKERNPYAKLSHSQKPKLLKEVRSGKTALEVSKILGVKIDVVFYWKRKLLAQQ